MLTKAVTWHESNHEVVRPYQRCFFYIHSEQMPYCSEPANESALGVLSNFYLRSCTGQNKWEQYGLDCSSADA